MDAIVKAVKIFGGQNKLAEQLGVTPQAVNQWVHGARITAERAVQIENVTGGEVQRSDLRPDIYGRHKESKGEAA